MRLTSHSRLLTVMPASERASPCFKYSLCFREYFFYEMAIPELVGDDIALVDLFIAFLSPIRLGDVHESGGERVVGDEGGGKTDDG